MFNSNTYSLFSLLTISKWQDFLKGLSTDLISCLNNLCLTTVLRGERKYLSRTLLRGDCSFGLHGKIEGHDMTAVQRLLIIDNATVANCYSAIFINSTIPLSLSCVCRHTMFTQPSKSRIFPQRLTSISFYHNGLAVVEVERGATYLWNKCKKKTTTNKQMYKLNNLLTKISLS